jgi:hypothetical protein
VTSGIGWVIGGLLAIFAVVLVVAGATGHAQNLIPTFTGMGTNTKSSTTANQSADQVTDAALSALGASGTPQNQSGTTPPALSTLPGVVV